MAASTGPSTDMPDTPDTSSFDASGPSSSIVLPADISATYPGYSGAVTIYHSQRSPELVASSRSLIKLLAGNYQDIESQLKQTTAPTFKPAPADPNFNPGGNSNNPTNLPDGPADLQSVVGADSLPRLQGMTSASTGLGPADSTGADALGPLGASDSLGPLGTGSRLAATGLGPGDSLGPGGTSGPGGPNDLGPGGSLDPGTDLADFTPGAGGPGGAFAGGPVTSFDPGALGGGDTTGLLGGPGGLGPGGPGDLSGSVPNLGAGAFLPGPGGVAGLGRGLGTGGLGGGLGGLDGVSAARGLGSGGVGPDGEPLGANGLPLSGAEREALAEQQGLNGAGAGGAGAAEEAAALGGEAGGMPMMPGMGMGGMGAGAGQGDRGRTTWLEEDRDVWGGDEDVMLGAIGRPLDGDDDSY